MRKLLAVAATVLVIGGSAACDPPEDDGLPTVQPAEPIDLGNVELVSLVREDSCADLLDWYRTTALERLEDSGGSDAFGVDTGVQARNFTRERALAESANVVADGAVSAAAPSAAISAPKAGLAASEGGFSTTNLQEEGVDEPDLVKTDGRLLVALAGNHLRVVDLTGPKPVLRSSVPMPGAHALFLGGPEPGGTGEPSAAPLPEPSAGRPSASRVVVIGSDTIRHPISHGPAVDVPAASAESSATDADLASGATAPVGPGVYEPTVTVTVVDLADPGAPKVGAPQRHEGSFVSARMTDGVMRLVLRSAPFAIADRMTYEWDDEGRLRDDVRAANEALIESAPIEDWKPDGVACEDVHHPRTDSGLSTVTVVTFDPDDAEAQSSASVTGAGETVYASSSSLYVTSSVWNPEATAPTTQIHAFDIADPTRTRYTASGSVNGTLLNQFSLSEHEGVLRIATTTVAEDSNTESQIVTLRRVDAGLQQVGIVGGLGKTEQIYAVRFLGDQGYVVTYRQTDPLYVVDLRDPEEPKVTGELKIPGYSAYLHPIGEGRLLGIGQDATDEGRRLGAQLSLFDVSDPASPKRLATHDLQAFGSSAEYDHHAFLWWARSALTVVPVESVTKVWLDDQRRGFTADHRPGAVGVALDGDAFVERGRLEHPDRSAIARSIVVGDRLLTVSDGGVLDSDLSSFTNGTWLAF